MKVRDEGTNNDNVMHERCEMNEKMKLNPKTKQSATKYKVNKTC